jgi:hypothetical protein
MAQFAVTAFPPVAAVISFVPLTDQHFEESSHDEP